MILSAERQLKVPRTRTYQSATGPIDFEGAVPWKARTAEEDWLGRGSACREASVAEAVGILPTTWKTAPDRGPSYVKAK